MDTIDENVILNKELTMDMNKIPIKKGNGRNRLYNNPLADNAIFFMKNGKLQIRENLGEMGKQFVACYLNDKQEKKPLNKYESCNLYSKSHNRSESFDSDLDYIEQDESGFNNSDAYKIPLEFKEQLRIDIQKVFEFKDGLDQHENLDHGSIVDSEIQRFKKDD